MSKGTLGAQMVDLQLPQVVQSLKAQAWSDEVNNYVLLKIYLLNCHKTIIDVMQSSIT
jgi:hypothetical protein